uniref:Histidine kinase/HSP90-like ATPase domain-containing protein n=1 Tax=Phenylobacterium glaciei TaxID=2803784 RepID=A0A974P3K9_9CAUL|nr:hypothetical protein JKL49_26140 [Phenylobacterium glaciei]
MFRLHSSWPCSSKRANARGRTVDGETIYHLVSSIHGLSWPEAEVATTFLCEAIQNVVQHGSAGASEGRRPEWQAHAAFNAETRTVLLSVVDDGVGIPMSLAQRIPTKPCGDTQLVAHAVAAPRAPRGRGNGFASMIQWIDCHPGSELVVRSLAGGCTYRSGTGLEPFDEAEYVQGTVVCLALALPNTGPAA